MNESQMKKPTFASKQLSNQIKVQESRQDLHLYTMKGCVVNK